MAWVLQCLIGIHWKPLKTEKTTLNIWKRKSSAMKNGIAALKPALVKLKGIMASEWRSNHADIKTPTKPGDFIHFFASLR